VFGVGSGGMRIGRAKGLAALGSFHSLDKGQPLDQPLNQHQGALAEVVPRGP
jgi:hypothetical protein